MDEFVTIATFTYPQDLMILKGRLESEGIICFVKDELTVQTDNFVSNAIGGVILQVKSSDAEKAVQILEEVGILPEKPVDAMAFWNKIDKWTNTIPMFKRLRVEAGSFLCWLWYSLYRCRFI